MKRNESKKAEAKDLELLNLDEEIEEDDDYWERDVVCGKGYVKEDVGNDIYDEYEDEDGYEEYIDDYEDEYEYEEDIDEKDDECDNKRIRRGRRTRPAKRGRLDAMDKIVMSTGALLMVFAIVTCSMYVSAKTAARQVASFEEVGAQMEGIEVIGESGLLAMADAQAAKAALEEAALESSMPEMEYEEKDLDTKGSVEVEMNLSSMQKDLKIKFVNKKTGKLVPNVLFEVSVTDSGKKSYVLKDEDMDGIIYQTDVAPGNCSVAMNEIKDAQEYIISTQSVSVTIKDKIEYKKVDVSNEVKKESEVNAAIEDTKKQETVVESVLSDTVGWVESTKNPVDGSSEAEGNGEYEEVSKDKITDPTTMASANVFLRFAAVDGSGLESMTDIPENQPDGSNLPADEAENQPDESDIPASETGNQENPPGDQIENPANGSDNTNPAQEIMVSLDCISLEMKIGESRTIKAATNPAGISVTWSSTDTGVATVQDGVVTALKAGVTDIVVMTQTGENAICKIVVKEEEEGKPTLTISESAAKIFTEKSVQLTAQVQGTEDKSVTWKSNNDAVATVAEDGTVKGISAGTAVITAICNADNSVTASCEVTVKADPEKDTVTKLKDNDGNQLYVVDADGKYREAVYADYFTADKFYKKAQNVEYKYTGWQTIDGKTYYFDSDGNKVTGEQIIQGAKYTFDSEGVLSVSSGNMGIDVSKWNGNIDWNAVKNSGVSYVIIRCGYRGSTTGALIEDPKFRANIQGASAAGLKVGIYFFTQAVNEVEAVEEASMVASLISGYKISYPVFLDVEASGGRADGISKETRTAVCQAFCQTMQNSGYTAGIYANTTWLTSKINAGSLTNYKIWLAQYAAAPTYSATRYDMWQYSAKGNVAGIKGSTDMNISYLGY